MPNKIVVYCQGNCCETCFGEVSVKPLVANSSVTYGSATQAMIDRWGLSNTPTILFLKNNAIAKKIEGKCMNGEVKQALDSLKWIV